MVWPIILISLGVLFLLNTLNVLPWGVWQTLWRLWPVILILVGVDLLLGRISPWLSAAVALLVIGAVAVWLAVAAPALGWGWAGPAAPAQQRLVEPLNGASEASLDVKFGAGRLMVNALEEGTGSLMEGEFWHRRGEDGVEKALSRRNGVANLSLTVPPGRWTFPGSQADEEWRVFINPDIPTSLRVQVGAAEADLDLRDLEMKEVSVDAGASALRVEMPAAAGHTVARIKVGAADLKIEIPEGVAARISTKSGLASVNVDENRFPRRGDLYESADFGTAANRIDLSIDAGAASVQIR